MMRFVTAGESHGPSLTAVVEGLPAGLPIDEEKLNEALARNLYRGAPPAAEQQAAVAGWIAAMRARLAACATQDLLEGRL